MIDLTPIARMMAARRIKRLAALNAQPELTQMGVLRYLLSRGVSTEIGRKHDFSEILKSDDIYQEFTSRIEPGGYEDIREQVMRMIRGEADVLWPGKCNRFAQSSGTSGGRSKYIPITSDSLYLNHYRGASDSVVHYLKLNPQSHILSGKGLTLGGSFSNTLTEPLPPGVKVGDLSATLIDTTPFPMSRFRTPPKRIALMEDWERKLPALAMHASLSNITNISGVPSWMLTVLRKVLAMSGKDSLHEVWPGLEVFLHGGISFAPYKEEYSKILDMDKMHFLENYNASEGFFAMQDDFSDSAMLLLIDAGIFYEFSPIDDPTQLLPLWETEEGKVYELVVTGVNGLWRYRVGDTVRICSVNPYKIKVEGRTKTYINAFGEELMESNAEGAVAEACRLTGASVANYTAAPIYARDGRKGRHQWVVEWNEAPSDMAMFTELLDTALRKMNSDYDAKRQHTIFLDAPLVESVPRGTFDKWLATHGNGKLGGQRKVPRLSNDRTIIEQVLNCV